MLRMGALAKPVLSIEQYLEYDEAADERIEYYNGEVFPIEAGTWNHGMVQHNLHVALDPRIRNSPCRALLCRVRVRPDKYLQPDLAIVCGIPQFSDKAETVTNPRVVFEILSKSTQAYDFGEKRRLYLALPSVAEYILVSQTEPLIETFRVVPKGSPMVVTTQGLESPLEIASLGIAIPLAEIYQGVEFPAQQDS